jgi:acetyltransferase-like isoleucine patch superfamily enzyme
MKRIMNLMDRMLFYEGLVFYLILIYDRLVFHVFYKYYYRKRFFYYGKNIRWGKHFQRLTIPHSVRIATPQKISIGDNCQFDEYTYIQCHHDGEGLFIGNNVRANAFTHIQAFTKITVEDYVLMAPFSHINSGNHGFDDSSIPIMNQPYSKAGAIVVGRGSWVGRGSQILGGVSLGTNCVVASGAVVTRSFPDHSVIGGVPAKNLRRVDVS